MNEDMTINTTARSMASNEVYRSESKLGKHGQGKKLN